jgi:LacI family transcriptional regulator
MGKRIPEDISICGVDDIDIASHQSIRLTTVGNYKQQMGVLAIEMLMNLIESEEEAQQPIQIVLRPELIVRETTGACLL